MTETSYRGLIEGSLLLAVWLLLAIITAFTPIGLASAFLLPVPVVVLMVRQGLGPVALLIALTFIAPLFIGIDLPRTLVMALASALPGLALGFGYQQRWKPTMVFALGLGGNMLAVFLLMNLLSLLFGLNVVSEMLALLRQASELIAQGLESIQQLPTQGLERLLEDWPLLQEGAVFLVPGFILMVLTAATFFMLNICQMVLARLGVEVESFPPFVKWRFGDWYLWLFVLALFLRFVAWQWHPFLMVIGYNIFSPLFYGMVIQGMAVVYWWLRVIPWKPVRILPLFTIVFPFVFMLFSLVGMADFLFNFRRL